MRCKINALKCDATSSYFVVLSDFFKFFSYFWFHASVMSGFLKALSAFEPNVRYESKAWRGESK